MDKPRICSQTKLEFKMKRENLKLKILIDKENEKHKITLFTYMN